MSDVTSESVRCPSIGYRWYVLGVLLAIFMVLHVDRQVISLLLLPIGHEFGLTDTQLGLLAGTAYAVAFAIAGIPLGYLCDRAHRVRLLSCLLAVWSSLTALGALCGSFASLLLLRIGVGAAESGGSPANLSLLSDYFDRRRRSTAIGVYMMGPQLGTIIGFSFIGVVAANYGWRSAFIAAGLPGLLLLLLVITTIREPPRDTEGGIRSIPGQSLPPQSIGTVMRELIANRALLHIVMGLGITAMVSAGVATWLPTLLMRSHDVSIQSAALSIAFGVGPVAALGSIASGFLADHLESKSRRLIPRMIAVATLITIPCIVVGSLCSSYTLAIVAFATAVVAQMAVGTPCFALSLSLVSAHIRGTTAALLQVVINLLGYGVGPQFVGFLSDLMHPSAGTDSLRYALAIFCLFNVWACAHFMRASAWLARAGDCTRENLGAQSLRPLAK